MRDNSRKKFVGQIIWPDRTTAETWAEARNKKEAEESVREYAKTHFDPAKGIPKVVLRLVG